MTGRGTASERREQVRRTAAAAFATSGLHGVSIDTIAREAGISEAYVFALFGSKRALFLDVVVDAFDTMTEGVAEAAEGLTGTEALTRMGNAYVALLADKQRLLLQTQGIAACGDLVVRETMRSAFGRLWGTVARLSGLDEIQVKTFMGLGALTNTLAALDIEELHSDWATAAKTFVPFE